MPSAQRLLPRELSATAASRPCMSGKNASPLFGWLRQTLLGGLVVEVPRLQRFGGPPQ